MKERRLKYDGTGGWVEGNGEELERKRAVEIELR